MAVEVELKYAADDERPLRRLAEQATLGPVRLGTARAVEERDRYLDTDDGRLAAARWACRLREREGTVRVSLKGPAVSGSEGGMHRRPESEGPASRSTDPTDWPPSDARRMLDRMRGGRALVERFTLVQHRTERAVIAGDAPTLGTLSLDVVRVEAAGRPRGGFHTVELELRADADAADEALLAELGETLGACQGLRPDPASKLEHALAIIGDR